MDIVVKRKLWARVIAKSWVNQTYREALVSKPKETLTNEGFNITEGITLHMVDTPQISTSEDVYLYLPPTPLGGGIKRGETYDENESWHWCY